jgi:hypothetical protein
MGFTPRQASGATLPEKNWRHRHALSPIGRGRRRSICNSRERPRRSDDGRRRGGRRTRPCDRRRPEPRRDPGQPLLRTSGHRIRRRDAERGRARRRCRHAKRACQAPRGVFGLGSAVGFGQRVLRHVGVDRLLFRRKGRFRLERRRIRIIAPDAREPAPARRRRRRRAPLGIAVATRTLASRNAGSRAGAEAHTLAANPYWTSIGVTVICSNMSLIALSMPAASAAS